MSITFIKKLHTCSECGERGKALLAIRYNRDIELNFPAESRPEELKSNGIYEEFLTRNDFGLTISRVVKEKPCEKCGKLTLTEDYKLNEDNVMNFYPKTEAHKWLDGLGKVGL